MRLQHWIVPAIGMVVALGGSRHVSAQFDPTRIVPADDPYAAAAAPMMSPFPYNDPSANGQYPAMQAAHFQPAAAPPQSTVPPDWIEPGQVSNYSPLLIHPPDSAAFPPPPEFQPWPQISPYDHRFQQHYREQGLWFQKTNDEADKRYFSADLLVTRYNTPNHTTFGAPGIEDPLVTNSEDVFGHFDYAGGLQLRLGVWKPDDSGFQLTGFYAGEINDVNPIRGLVLFTSTQSWHTQAGGAGITRWCTPFLNRGSLEIRQSYGARWLGISEEFEYQATDFLLVNITEPFTNKLVSEARTQMGGPEVGLQLRVGGESVKLSVETKAGVMGTQEVIHLTGNGWGVPHDLDFENTFFHDDESHSHLSPHFEGNFNFDIDLFEVVPILNKWHIFEHAKVRAGYTFLAVGEVARPLDNVVYRETPINPRISVNRSTWVMQAWNFGVEWTR